MKASVALITYRQEAYIAQAIESALMQQTDFEFEIVIGEDCSPDRTGEIVKDFAARHPGRIRLLPRDKNIGMMRNWMGTFLACKGQYIAALEGDDYWTDPQKLQRQVSAMDSQPDWTGCFHRVRYLYTNGSREPAAYPPVPRPAVCTMDELLGMNPIQTCSVMFRRGVIRDFPAGFESLSLGDWPTCMLHAIHGPIGFLDHVMADYRLHPGGVWSHQSDVTRYARLAEVFEFFIKELTPLKNPRAKAWIASCLINGSQLLELSGQTKKARSFAWRAARLFLSPGFPYKDFRRRILNLYCPPLQRAGTWGKRMLRGNASRTLPAVVPGDKSLGSD